jgi:hypothetical protein
MTNAADPVGTGLVASLARPGGNITGLSDFNEGVVAKRLALVKDILPAASRVAVLYNPANPTNPRQFKLTQDAARTLGMTLLPLEARTALRGSLPARGLVRGQGLEGRQPGGPADRAAEHLRIRLEPSDRAQARADRAAVHHDSRRSRDRVTRQVTTSE